MENQPEGEKMINVDPEYENEQEEISSDTSSSQDVENLEGANYVVRNEDRDESEQLNSQNIIQDGPQYENEQDEILSDTSSSQDVEDLERDAYVVENEDHKESKQENSQNISQNGPKYENEQEDISSDTSNSQDVEDREGETYDFRNEDHEELKQVNSQNISHEGPKYENEQKKDISDDMSSSQEDENIERDTYVVMNEDHDESKQVNSQTIFHDGPKHENELEDTSSETSSSQDVEKQEGDTYVVQNENHEESKQMNSQNISNDSLKYENVQKDISSGMSSSQDVENLERGTYVVQNEDHVESKQANSQNNFHDVPQYENEQEDISSDTSSSQDDEKLQGVTYVVQNEACEESKQVNSQNISHNGLKYENEQQDTSLDTSSSQNVEKPQEDTYVVQNEDHMESKQENSQNTFHDVPKHENEQDISSDTSSSQDDEKLQSDALVIHDEDYNKDSNGEKFDNNCYESPEFEKNLDDILDNIYGVVDVESMTPKRMKDKPTSKSEISQNPRVIERAVSLKNFVREKSIVAVSTLMHRLSRKNEDCYECKSDNKGKDISDLSKDNEAKKVSEKTPENPTWSPLNFIKISSDVVENKIDNRGEPITEGPLQHIAMKGRVILYTRLGCGECKEARKFLYMKRLRYVEINIDVYPGRKMELEKISGSSSVPKVFFNEVLIGGLSDLKTLNESGELCEKIDFLITESPSFEAPFPPLSGEDDVSSSGALDEMALVVHKMKESIVVKDRFSKLRRFTNCFLGSEAVDFLSEDQYLERREAVEFGRKLASKLFFQHVFDENIFEDGNYLYRFLDDDPIVSSQCHNIPRGIITVKPKPITEIASRLRLLSYAMFEAYASEDGRHVDYRSMHGSEEFARYLRIVEELQRVEVLYFSREEKIAFFLNLYNMMTIHAILVWGHPAGALERRKLFGDFKYVIGGSAYSLSAIQNGILRANQRQPYTLMKPFGVKDRRLKVALSFPEPLIHFAIVCGTRSGPALRCYSPEDIDSELMDATRNFLRNGGLLIDFTAKVSYASKILRWFSVDFGKNEVEVMKHVSIYLDPSESEQLFDLLDTSELKVIYQPYDWGLNC